MQGVHAQHCCLDGLVLQNKLQLPQLKIEFRRYEHTRSLGEATAAQKLYLKLGLVQLVLQYQDQKLPRALEGCTGPWELFSSTMYESQLL